MFFLKHSQEVKRLLCILGDSFGGGRPGEVSIDHFAQKGKV